MENTDWNEISPKSESYLFIPRDEKLLQRFEQWPKVTDIFPVNSVGIVTARDKLTIKYSANDVWTTVLNFSKMDVELARQAYGLGKDVRDWKVDFAQKDLIASGPEKLNIVPILYRPFDIRYTYYTGKSRGFHCMPRREVMRHMMEGNLALVSARSNKSTKMDHFFCSKQIMETKCGESTTQSCLFPLYLYPDTEKQTLFTEQKQVEGKQPNINPEILAQLSGIYAELPSPEMIFYYIYSVLYSETYRKRYAEFLKTDFPRIPFTKDFGLFLKMVEYGERLADLHLMNAPDLDSPISRFQGSGDERVDKVRYDEKDHRIYINKDQYFENVAEYVWQYHIGGYQVCNKWLKDRKGRTLSLSDVKHYCKIVTAIEKTLEIQKSLDEVYPKIEKTSS
jgi:predicted helicase